MQNHSNPAPEKIQLGTRARFQFRNKSIVIAAALVAVAGLSFSNPLAASNEQESRGPDHARECSLATLQGRYLFAESGVLLPPAFGVAAPTPSADAGIHTFNGNGTGTDTVTLRIGNNIVLKNVVSPFDYTVNPDCTGTMTVLNGPSFDIFIAPDGREFAKIATAPAGNYAVSIDQRVSRNW